MVSDTGTSEPRFIDPWLLEVMDTWQAAAERRDGEGWIDAAVCGFLP